ncbi:hypothetical protein HPG69_009215 [Diceros bicornis minor]|uniref:Ig-like domain-containing protein n=1 Tax=Diceros bicornis minor TaxID=77932 RepID=A0A7J7F014_DICBM|nr:hypothetical protein HPG69_009215 [Diceros bicornis minor]
MPFRNRDLGKPPALRSGPACPRGAPSVMPRPSWRRLGPPSDLPLSSPPGAQEVQVRVLPEVRGRLGDTVELPCHLLPPAPEVQVSQVTWMRVDATGSTLNVAVFHPSYGPSFPSPKPGKERLSFVTARQSAGTGQGTKTELQDATLALGGLTVEDEGNYTCEFATFPQGTGRGVTWLRAIAQPQNHAETQEVSLSLEPVPVARCVSTGGRPPARISWLSPLDGEARESQVAGSVPGTVTVTSRFTLVPLGQADGVKVTCKVEHESFEEPVLLPVILSVRFVTSSGILPISEPVPPFPADPPEVSISGYDDNWYLGRTSAIERGHQLIIHSVDRLVNTTFICTVTNAVGTGHAEQVVLVRDTPRASTRDVGPVVWGAVGGTLLVLLLLAGGSLTFILLRMRRRRKSPGGGGDGARGASYEAKTQAFGNGGPVYRTPTAPGPPGPDGKDEEDEEDEDEKEEKAEKGLMLPPSPTLEDDMESQLDGSLISRRAVYSPNTAGAGATGGIIGGIIAAIIAIAVAATGIIICRQQRKEQGLQGAEEEDDLEGPPSYKPPTPKAKLEEPEMPSQLFTLGASEHSPLKTPYFDAGVSCTEQEMPRYHELPTLEERSGPLLMGATSLGSPIPVPPGPPAVERVSLDLEDEEEEEEDYLDKINPIYDALSYSSPSDSYQSKGFVMSRAMYV